MPPLRGMSQKCHGIDVQSRTLEAQRLEASLSTLLTSLTTTPTCSTAPAASNALLAADDALTHSLTTLKKHQQNYARILHLRAEATRLENQIKSIIRTCGELRSEIGEIH